jgi:hypothetical protein
MRITEFRHVDPPNASVENSEGNVEGRHNSPETEVYPDTLFVVSNLIYRYQRV